MYVAARDNHALTVLYSVQFCGFNSHCQPSAFSTAYSRNKMAVCYTRLTHAGDWYNAHTLLSPRECNHVLAAVWLTGCTPKTHPSARRWQHLPNKISQIALACSQAIDLIVCMLFVALHGFTRIMHVQLKAQDPAIMPLCQKLTLIVSQWSLQRVMFPLQLTNFQACL